MRYLICVFCVYAAACAGTSPISPTAPPGSGAPTLSSSPSGPTAPANAEHGVALPFEGNLEAAEAVDGAVHHLTGTGNGTHLGRFTYAADITVDGETGDGVGSVIWTAANGDEVHADTHGAIVQFDFPTITLRETQVITGGTGRFSRAAGTILVNRALDLLTHHTAGSYSGTIDLGR
jgi:hypothetical protein